MSLVTSTRARHPLRRVAVGLGSALLFCGLAAESGAQVEVVFSKTYVRSPGPPLTVIDSFAACDPAGEFTLVVDNGPGGAQRVSSATISVNGVEIVHPSDLNQQVEHIERPLSNVAADNPMAVRLAGAPGGAILLSVRGVQSCSGPVEGVLLPGDPGSPAHEAMTTFILPGGLPLAEFSLDDAGLEVARTQFEVGFTSDATVGEVNALLESIDSRIVSMLQGVLIVVVRIPDPGSLAALDTLIAGVESSSIVRFVNKSRLPAPAELPSNHAAGSADIRKIDHHLAVRSAAAWNARAALDAAGAQKPLMVVADFFGDGPPNADVDAALSTSFGSGKPNSHGYHVLGIMSAGYGGDTSARGLATGMFPDTLDVGIVDEVVNATDVLSADLMQNLILAFVQAATGNVVVSTSLAFDCSTAAAAAAYCNQAYAAEEALIWIEKVAASGLENRFLHVTAAGNVSVPGDTDARFGSWFAAARLLPGLQVPAPSGPIAVPNLTNTLVVEDVVNSLLEPFPPMCLSYGSRRAGDLAGIGTGVHSVTGASAGAGDENGTSMSTPQVAGLAAYVWSLNPLLTVQEVMGILLSRASPGVGNVPGVAACDLTATSSPVIDAYASILAADRASALSGSGPPSEAPARLAILDVADGTGAPANADGTPTGNGAFDEYDIELFKQEFAAASGVDFSRFDLNGDGYTGTFFPGRFDLDNSGFAEVIAQDIDGSAVSFDESGLTDLQILCYYAYSSLFTGDPAIRDGQIGDDCSLPITIKSDGTRISWQIYDADENNICCGNPLFLAQDSLPPVSMALGDGSFVAHRPTPNALAIDVTGRSFLDPASDASSGGGVLVRAELAFDSPGTLVVDIDPAFGTGSGIVVVVSIPETGEYAFCTRDDASFVCVPTAGVSSPVPGPGTRTVDVSVSLSGGNSTASGRAVTIRRQ